MKFSQTIVFQFVFLTLMTGQSYERMDIAFSKNGIPLTNPTIGGLIAPQFSHYDFNADGTKDLLVFDREGNRILPFVKNGSVGSISYEFAPQYIGVFPPGREFYQLHDFNGDGLMDIFTSPPIVSGIQVYRNVGTLEAPQFEAMTFTDQNLDYIPILANGLPTNLYVSNIDIPAFVDTNGDGDLDILTFESGGSYVHHYKNFAVEEGNPDTIIMRLTDICWGKFYESGFSEEIDLSGDPNNCAIGFTDGNSGNSRHAGSTLTAFDGDGDGDLDLLLGDLGSPGLLYLENGGDSEEAFIISQETNFPQDDIPANMNIFLGSFYIDVNGDGVRDLIATINNELGSDNIDHVWLYINEGADNNPQFRLETKNFLIDQTLNLGVGTVPTFLDVNGDGLQDILVGNNGIVKDNSKNYYLYLLQNTGSKDQPKYDLVDEDFLNFNTVATGSNGALHPTAGDVDGDGDTDLLIGNKPGFLYFYENTAGSNMPMTFEPFVYPYEDIKVGLFVKPSIFDADGDGLNDLIIGEQNDTDNSNTGLRGGLNFIRNLGTEGNPAYNNDEFGLENIVAFGGVYTRSELAPSGGSAPHFILSQNKPMLMVGSRGGELYLYEDIYENVNGSFTLVSDSLPVGNIGRFTTLSAADIDDDNYYEIVVGSNSGGIQLFNTPILVNIETSVTDNDYKDDAFIVTPNPATAYVRIQSSIGPIQSLTVWNEYGQLMTFKNNIDNTEIRIPLDGLASGIYHIQLLREGKVYNKRVIKL